MRHDFENHRHENADRRSGIPFSCLILAVEQLEVALTFWQIVADNACC
jgi:hypothetical protein